MTSSQTLKNFRSYFLKSIFYFLFLFISLFLIYTPELNKGVQFFILWLYVICLVGQWFFLGKEIDYYFGIYYKVKSSLDRVIYRIFVGLFVSCIYFNILNLFSRGATPYLFWGTWLILGIFYSFPRKKKEIDREILKDFYAHKTLDSFEKILIGLIVVMFVFSAPKFPQFQNLKELQSFLDPRGIFVEQFWNFLTLSFHPFTRRIDLLSAVFFSFFYLVGTGLFLVIFYAFLRYFVVRRLSLLGVFAILSSWSYSTIMINNFGDTISTTYTILLMWSILWVTQSSNYRLGFFLGFVGAWGCLFDIHNIILFVIQIILIFFIFLNQKTNWFKGQFLKYISVGLFLAMIFLILGYEQIQWNVQFVKFFDDIQLYFGRKSFFILASIGMPLFITNIFYKNILLFAHDRTMKICSYMILAFALKCLFSKFYFFSFSIIWPIAFFSLLPIEYIFQEMRRSPSKRNMIYLIYISICLLDSHFEERIKIFIALF